MKKQNKRRTKKIRNLVIACTLSAIILAVSTYAWFIGMKTVKVSSFDIDIATTEGLFLSMDGKNWSYKLDARNVAAYTGNTNTWALDGLIPVSSVGDMDSVSSRMKLFEKGSLTTTKGGFRLLTSRVNNHTTTDNGVTFTQGKGYVAFDLFIKNLSGTEYYATNNVGNEEAIYLTTNSAVTVAAAGENGGVANTGIENSVRVAFAQIGRVKADTTKVSNITAISCSNVAADSEKQQVQVTGICRDAQIWEPNDTKHVQNAITWYDTSCRVRKSTGTDVTVAESYDTATHCAAVTDTSAAETKETYPTYAISRPLLVDDNVDVYDGKSYNSYEANSKTYKQYKEGIARLEEDTDATLLARVNTFKLVEFPYFTDTMKNKTGTSRPTFMTLAPNSITKVRVYIYIEGQDVDNYDFASLGKKISVNFGFTKERYIETDIGYSGPSTDITPTIETATTEQATQESGS